MDKIIIEGGISLKGSVKVSGSKNAALPLMAASLLTSEKVVLTNVPDLADIRSMTALLNHMGVTSTFLFHRLALSAKKVTKPDAPYDLVRKMRASFWVLGPLIARFGKARVSLPGGCAIGTRPVNLYIDGLERLGARVELDGGYVIVEAPKGLKGAEIIFPSVSVGATHVMMMAAALAEGKTALVNAAREPEVIDLADLLIKMGAKISGHGSDVITIEGVEKLHGAEHAVIPDRIEAGTFMIAAAMTRGNVMIDSIEPVHVEALTQKLRDTGAEIEVAGRTMRVVGPKSIKSIDIKTAPYPGFATDFQAQFTAMMTIADGTSTITETIFENRFMHVPELARMGADLQIEGNTVIVKGTDKLQPAPIMASDLRASASLVLAALVAKGVTEIHRVYHIDRGYEGIEKKLRKLGAKVKRAKVKY